jgi:hypothetical protein
VTLFFPRLVERLNQSIKNQNQSALKSKEQRDKRQKASLSASDFLPAGLCPTPQSFLKNAKYL